MIALNASPLKTSLKWLGLSVKYTEILPFCKAFVCSKLGITQAIVTSNNSCYHAGLKTVEDSGS